MDAIQEAKKLFNETWDLLDKVDRTEEEAILMLHKAHASCLLWRHANNPLNDARGAWQVSRVYSVLGYGQPALLHAKHSLDLCLKHDIRDFDLAFGYEAVARAYSILGDGKKTQEYRELAIDAAEKVADEGDRAYVLDQIGNIQQA